MSNNTTEIDEILEQIIPVRVVSVEDADGKEWQLDANRLKRQQTSARLHKLLVEAKLEVWENLSIIDWCNLRAPEVRRLRDDRIKSLKASLEGEEV